MRPVLLQHLEYTAWATGRLLDSCAALPEEELSRDLAALHGGILDTLRHIYYADRIWLARLKGEARAFKDPKPEMSLAQLREKWPELLARFRSFLAELPDEQIDSNLEYRNLKGEGFSAGRWKIVFHVVNHATLHRGQVVAMLRQLGHQPPVTDLIYFYLEAAK